MRNLKKITLENKSMRKFLSLRYQILAYLKMAHKRVECCNVVSNVGTFATATQCNLHCNGLCVICYIAKILYLKLIDRWRIFQKNKGTFNWGFTSWITAVTIFWQFSWLYIVYNHAFFQNLKVLFFFPK